MQTKFSYVISDDSRYMIKSGISHSYLSSYRDIFRSSLNLKPKYGFLTLGRHSSVSYQFEDCTSNYKNKIFHL